MELYAHELVVLLIPGIDIAALVEDINGDVLGEGVAFRAEARALLVGSVGVVAIFALGGMVFEVPERPFFLIG